LESFARIITKSRKIGNTNKWFFINFYIFIYKQKYGKANTKIGIFFSRKT
jgi:hypothetical protein